MCTVRQKRKSCEACRARKLKCSGQETGCSRCVHLSIVCDFQDKGLPGRPRKWSLNEAGEPQQPTQVDEQEKRRQSSQTQLHARRTSDPQDEACLSSLATKLVVATDGNASVAVEGDSADLLSSVQHERKPDEQDKHDETTFDFGDSGMLPSWDFKTNAELEALPLDSFGACLFPPLSHREPTGLSPAAPVLPTRPLISCDCSNQAFEIIRTLEKSPTTHDTVPALRQGIDIFGQLLNCKICYDVTKPPRFTIQNVILLGRLGLEVTSGYQRYLAWVKAQYLGPAEKQFSDTVYLMPHGVQASAIGLSISGDKFYELIAHGLHNDVQRLSNLGSQFATRQRNRHLIGHEACPDWEGRCWKGIWDMDPDPLDVCPQSPAAQALTRCYRIVDEVRAKIKQFEDATA